MTTRGPNSPCSLAIEGIMRLAREQDLKRDSRLPSVRELAEQCGVAKATVQQAVRQLQAEGLCYAVNRKGLFLAQDPPPPEEEVTTVGLVLNYERYEEEDNPFYRLLFEGAHGQSARDGLNVLTLHGWNTKSPLRKNRELAAFREQLSGLVALGVYSEIDCLRLRDTSLPLVAVDYETTDLGIDCVVIDNDPLMRSLCEHELRDGAKELFLVDLARKSDYDPAIAERHNAFREALKAAGVRSDDTREVFLGSQKGTSRLQNSEALLSAVRSGNCLASLICTDDGVARSLVLSLKDLGFAAGKDYRLAYLGPTETIQPDLADVPARIAAVDFRELSREGVRMLGRRIENGPGRAVRKAIDGRIVEWPGGGQ